MGEYKTILLAVDLSEEANQVATPRRGIGPRQRAPSCMLYTLSNRRSFAYGGDIPIDFSTIQDEIQKQAEAQLQSFCNRLGIPATRLHPVMGRPENEIHALAETRPPI